MKKEIWSNNNNNNNNNDNKKQNKTEHDPSSQITDNCCWYFCFCLDLSGSGGWSTEKEEILSKIVAVVVFFLNNLHLSDNKRIKKSVPKNWLAT